jgi:hypothetical protein
MPTPKKSNHTGLKMGLGLAAVAAAAAGTYYFYGKNATKRRQQLKAWMVQAKGDVMEKLESIPEISEAAYRKVISEVMKRYKTVKSIAPKEITALEKELISHWRSIKAEVEKSGTSRKSKAK